jgi:tryptophanyl-tRNA synthetase
MLRGRTGRGMVLSHRDLNKILDRYEKGEPFYVYTGRGPSSDSMHIGHSIPFEFTKWLQDVFDVPLIIMLTDDEKFMHSKKIKIEDAERYARENAKDIIGIGFDPKKTFIFSDYDFMGGAFYKNVTMMAKRITINSVMGTFGFHQSNNIGEFFFPAVQSATAFATSFPHIFGSDPLKARQIPCLIPCAIDQDPYFRQCREHAEEMKYKKPALIHSIFLPALQGPGSKMSASVDASAIFLTDTPAQIKKKINKYAFSGGQDTEEKHRELGGRADQDVAFQYLKFFMEDDDELEQIRQNYEKGDLLTGELKAICIKYLQEYVGAFQERRAKVTEEVRQEFMSERPLTYGGNPNPVVVEKAPKGSKEPEIAKTSSKADANEVKGHSRGKSTTKADAAEVKGHTRGKSTAKANGDAK